MPSCKYVTQDLFDERTGNMAKSLERMETQMSAIGDKVDKLNTWKLRVVTGASFLASVVAIVWQIVTNREAISAVFANIGK